MSYKVPHATLSCFILRLGERGHLLYQLLGYMLHIHFPASNNVAEYEALINGLRITVELGIR